MPIRELAARGKVWAFNGLAESPREPLFAARRGETVLLEMVNDTAWPHGRHLHGHHFRAVSADGSQVITRTRAFEEPSSAGS